MTAIVQVCIPNTRRDFFDYASEEPTPCIGARVWVPFRAQKKLGIVVGLEQVQHSDKSLKTIELVVDTSPILTSELLTLCTWIGQYYQAPLSEVLALALPKKYRLGAPENLPTTNFYELTCSIEQALERIPLRAKKQRALVELLAQHPMSQTMLSKAGYSSVQCKPLLAERLIQITQRSFTIEKKETVTSLPLVLNNEQKQAVDTIVEKLDQFQCYLLHGITGSGKTEVYLQVIAEVLAQKKQILVLVPEIGLTPQLVSRFMQRFNLPIAVIHSHLNETERQIAWQLAKENRSSIVIGTRAAVFTPMPELGLIVVDEEHDLSLKQMEGVRYSARDTALMRAHLAHIPIILGSATPSLESMHNCQQGKYHLLRLTQKALTTQALHYQLIDLRAQSTQHGLATQTIQKIAQHLAQDNQILVFINRRGFAPVLLCHQCGQMSDCHACDSHLTFHKKTGEMICHHCGFTQTPPQKCTQCHSSELIPVGQGTQRVDELLRSIFPNTHILRIDKDETRKKNAFVEHLELINSGKAQLIVGTQMLAKGHHFPRLSLVVVLDADAGLYNHDFRATEQLGQLLTQVAGRAGRAQYPGEVIIQTHMPQNHLINTLVQEGYDAFAANVLRERQRASLPPYHFLAVLRAQSVSDQAVLRLLHATKKYMSNSKDLTIHGPAPAPLPRKANQYRMQLLIKSPSRKVLNHFLTQMREWLTNNKLSQNIRWNVDVDPMDLS